MESPRARSDIIVSDEHSPAEAKRGDTTDSSSDIQYLINSLTSHEKDFNIKVGREYIFKKVGNECLYEINNNNNGVKVIKFATSKDLIVKSTVPYHDIHKHICISLDGNIPNQTDHILTDKS